MSLRMRSLVVLAGLSLLYAALLILIGKPEFNLATPVPPVPFSGNVFHFFYLRALQHVFGFNTGAVLIANGVLMLAICLLVFRVGWSLAEPRHRLQGAALAMLFFELNPLVLVLPLTLGLFGGYLWVPLLFLVFFQTMISVGNWSVFMRAISLAFAWSLLLWVHLPGALLILVASIPWMLYTRRPVTALGIFMTIWLLGTASFSALWMAACGLSGNWASVQIPWDALTDLGRQIQTLAASGGGGTGFFEERLIHVAGWLSPFLMVLGLWAVAKSLRRMVMERRADTGNWWALVSLLVLAGVLFTSEKDVLPGAWYLLLILIVWCPLLTQDLAKTENFFSRGFRLTALTGFLTSLVALSLLAQDVSRGLQVPPGAGTLLKLVLGVLGVGFVSRAVLKKHPLSFENRGQALLAGAMLGYFLVMDVWLFR